MDRRLIEAALTGNETTLNALINEDPLILHRISLTSFDDTPLHMASLYGNLDFVTAILSRKPVFLTKTDSFGRFPLHLACAEGHVEIVKRLFQACPEVAQIRDQDGRTPLELAALNEQVGVLSYLLRENLQTAKMTTASDSRETILHSCVRHNSIGALKLLVDCWDMDEVINSQDEDGNNLLHVAVIHKQIQTVKYLLGEVGFCEKWNSKNRNGFTAVDVLDHCPRDWRTLELHSILMKSGVRRAKELNYLITQPASSQDSRLLMQSNNLSVSQETSGTITQILPLSHLRKVWEFLRNAWVHKFKNKSLWAEEIRGNLLVAATLIATISFQAGLNPPGGVWQDSNNGHTAGTSIMASTNFEDYFDFVLFNTIAFALSSCIILLMVSGFPLNSKALMAILMLAMTFTILLMWLSYGVSLIEVSTPNDYRIYRIFYSVKQFYNVVLAMVTLFYVAQLLVWSLRKVTRVVKAGSGLIKWIKTRVQLCVTLPSSHSTVI